MNQKTKINGYDLSRAWFNFCFDNPDIIKPHHSAIYFFAVNQCNRFGWKDKFGFPTTLAMEAVGIRSYRTYINALNDIVEWGFFKMIEKSKNQYTANIIALVFEAKAHDKALDKATQTHMTKQGQSTGESKAMVVKPLNHETIKPLNKSKAPTKKLDAPSQNESLEVYKEPTVDKRQNLKEKNVSPKKEKIKKWNRKDFTEFMESKGGDPQLISDWCDVRTKKRATFTLTVANSFIREAGKANVSLDKALEMCITRNWTGFESSWYNNAIKDNRGFNQAPRPKMNTNRGDHIPWSGAKK